MPDSTEIFCSTQAREHEKFVDCDGKLAVNVKICNADDISGGTSGADGQFLLGRDFDCMTPSETATQKIYTYELNSVVVRTITIDYIDASKCKVSKVSVTDV